jgi:Fur family ferric uptake transcriptional regulator
MLSRNKREAVAESFRAYLWRNGLTGTSQRSLVLDEIIGGPPHFDVEALAHRVRGRNTGVSRATVYRTVNHLEKARIVRKMDFDESHAHYEVIVSGGHHEHCICQQCGRITEFTDPALERRIERVAEDCGMEMTKHRVQIFGLCAACLEKRASVGRAAAKQAAGRNR